MKREELKAYWGGAAFDYYEKEEVDKVMDVMEKDNADLRHNLEDYKWENADLKNRVKELEGTRSKMYDANKLMNARIKELEQALDMASDPALHPTCADCDKCQPKWIAVKDKLPEEGETIYGVGRFLSGLFVLSNEEWYTREEFDDGLDEETLGYDIDAIDYWMKKPLPPSIEEK